MRTRSSRAQLAHVSSYRLYGTKGVASASNNPRGRESAVSWIDGSRNLWLFGGDSQNDLWKFSPMAGIWTWVSGSNTGSTAGVYLAPAHILSRFLRLCLKVGPSV
jgi:hypothetical protein